MILSLFKQKPILKDLIPKQFVDIHSHLLPGIDDGAKNIDDTISLINQMKEIGFQTFITTPHIINNVWNNTETSIGNKHLETKALIQEIIDGDNFNVAAEYMLDSYFLKRLSTEKLLTIKDNYILIEMSYLNPPIQLFDILFEIQLAGYKPILAHPERYLFYNDDLNEYEKIKNSGCLFQLNLLSTVNYYGTKSTKICDNLLKNDFYDFVGSDIHHQNHINAFNRNVDIKNIEQFEKVIQKNLFFSK
jgi:protein-tyrosine phosphatase